MIHGDWLSFWLWWGICIRSYISSHILFWYLVLMACSWGLRCQTRTSLILLAVYSARVHFTFLIWVLISLLCWIWNMFVQSKKAYLKCLFPQERGKRGRKRRIQSLVFKEWCMVFCFCDPAVQHFLWSLSSHFLYDAFFLVLIGFFHPSFCS